MYCKKYCDTLPNERFVILKSGLGTGKTISLLEIIVKNFLEFKSIIIVSARIAFANFICQTINEVLKNYNRQIISVTTKSYFVDYSNSSSNIDFDSDYTYLVISVESLHRVKKEKYNICLFDEINAIIKEFGSIFNGNNLITNRTIFDNLMINSDQNYFLDADINEISINFIKSSAKHESIYFCHNTYKPHTKLLYYFHSLEEQCLIIKDLLLKGKRLYITQCSAKTGIYIHNYIQNLNIINSNKIIYIYNSGNDYSKIFQNPNNELVKYDVVIVSPKFGMGISFDIPHFHSLIAFKNSLPIGIDDSFQVDFRIRNLIDNNIFISVKSRNDKCVTDEIKILDKINKNIINHRDIFNTLISNMIIINKDDPNFKALGGTEKIETIHTLDYNNKYVKAYIQNIKKDNLDKNFYMLRILQKIYNNGSRVAETNIYNFSNDELLEVKAEMTQIKLLYTSAYLDEIDKVENYTQNDGILNNITKKLIIKKATKNDKLTLKVNNIMKKFKNPESKVDPAIIQYFDENEEILYNHLEYVNCSEQEIMENDLNKNGINPHYKSHKFKIIKDIMNLLGFLEVNNNTSIKSDILVKKVEYFIIDNFENIKDYFGSESDKFYLKRDFQTCKNILNRIFKYIGLKFTNECGIKDKKTRIRSYDVKLEFIDTIFNNVLNLIAF